MESWEEGEDKHVVGVIRSQIDDQFGLEFHLMIPKMIRKLFKRNLIKNLGEN